MFNTLLKPGVFKHVRCRNCLYPRSKVERFTVADDLIFWAVPFEEYKPHEHTDSSILGKPWADDEESQIQWNEKNNNVDRTSFHGKYEIVNQRPQNPFGRTGICGRGLLGRWGPNHAADPVVTRWKRGDDGCIVNDSESQKGILQMVAIQRQDNLMWAIPGGMVDPGENVSETLKREFTEEALNAHQSSDVIQKFFKNGHEIYRGYVDDSRNTDQAWMETVAVHFHDDKGNQIGQFNFNAGSDAVSVKWLDLHKNIELNANHQYMVEQAVKILNAHW